ncbi:DUF2771 domain-containing protein [Streptomyces alkaliterrae]|uniref:DUF2771 domain-containing protein n=1 Tax=Streptomyces alkaliterrae TaxID=2213162 RepID=A0A5P0YS14_9ACTN|nr:DUF2771 domain-containing protein [Streptomyces alkaliterrae]MBB1255088.1 DUF2771 domain-containing protein [Streptomyces alkaliterrae]MBB1261581.1 DUF2771 domain-containing protein [Streptomyces alkaliterrae]MQS03106.1 DUF2771 domain-containing protein [Streptomyces alkaliterrae]
MTSMLSTGRFRRTARTALAAGATVCALAALSGCEKPTPVATVTIGSDSVTSEASCWNDGKKLSEKELKKCAEGNGKRKIDFGEGDVLRFGVDSDIAEKGWQVFLANQELLEPTTKTYKTFDGSQLRYSALPKETDLVIAQVNSAGKKEAEGFYGLWHFTLVKES